MSRSLKTVIVNGSLSRPSRTRVLLDALQARLGQELPLQARTIDLLDLQPHLGAALSKDDLPAATRQAIEDIEQADFLIVGAPVFRASLPGLLKHLFDLIDLDALQGKPVLLAATGGSPRHALILDHQLRPLFGFFSALTLPIGVYATPEDIQDGEVRSESLRQRIELTVQLSAPVLRGALQQLAQASDQVEPVAEEQAA
jgi:FMN reductase